MKKNLMRVIMVVLLVALFAVISYTVYTEIAVSGPFSIIYHLVWSIIFYKVVFKKKRA